MYPGSAAKGRRASVGALLNQQMESHIATVNEVPMMLAVSAADQSIMFFTTDIEQPPASHPESGDNSRKQRRPLPKMTFQYRSRVLAKSQQIQLQYSHQAGREPPVGVSSTIAMVGGGGGQRLGSGYGVMFSVGRDACVHMWDVSANCAGFIQRALPRVFACGPITPHKLQYCTVRITVVSTQPRSTAAYPLRVFNLRLCCCVLLTHRSPSSLSWGSFSHIETWSFVCCLSPDTTYWPVPVSIALCDCTRCSMGGSVESSRDIQEACARYVSYFTSPCCIGTV